MTRAPLTHMTPAQRESYLDWLLKLVAGKHGAIPDFYCKAVAQMRGLDETNFNQERDIA